MGKKVIIVLFIIVLVGLGVMVFNFLTDNPDYSKITYKGVEYECISNDISIVTMQYENVWQNAITQIDKYKKAEVYEIQGISNQELLYFHNPLMIGIAPMGLYKKSDIEIDIKTDDSVYELIIHDYDKRIQKTLANFNTNDKEVINSIIALLNNPAENVTGNILNANEEYYMLQFLSKKYNELSYNFHYVENINGNYYLKTDTKIYKIDDSLHNLLIDYVWIGGVSGVIDAIENDIIYINSERYGYVGVKSNQNIFNSRTGAEIRLENVNKGDTLSVSFEYMKDGNIITPVDNITITRNITGEELKEELILNLVPSNPPRLHVNTLAIENIEIISKDKALVTLSFMDLFEEESEKFDITVIVNDKTEIVGKGGLLNSIDKLETAKHDMITIELDVNTINDKNPVATLFSAYDS